MAGNLQQGNHRTGRQRGPHLAPLGGPGRGQPHQRRLVEFSKDPPHRRRRRDRPAHHLRLAQHVDRGGHIPRAVRERDRRIGHDLTTIVDWAESVTPQRFRQPGPKPGLLGEQPQQRHSDRRYQTRRAAGQVQRRRPRWCAVPTHDAPPQIFSNAGSLPQKRADVLRFTMKVPSSWEIADLDIEIIQVRTALFLPLLHRGYPGPSRHKIREFLRLGSHLAASAEDAAAQR